MNYGPLEFAKYLRKTEARADSAIVRAARAAQPRQTTLVNLLTAAPGDAGQGLSGLEAAGNPSPAPLKLRAE